MPEAVRSPSLRRISVASGLYIGKRSLGLSWAPLDFLRLCQKGVPEDPLKLYWKISGDSLRSCKDRIPEELIRLCSKGALRIYWGCVSWGSPRIHWDHLGEKIPGVSIVTKGDPWRVPMVVIHPTNIYRGRRHRPRPALSHKLPVDTDIIKTLR